MARIVSKDPLGVWPTPLVELRWTAAELRVLKSARRLLDAAGDELPEPYAFECKRAESALDELGIPLT